MLVHMSPSSRMRKIREVLPQWPQNQDLTYEAFMTAGVVYLRFSPFHRPFYIGSSELCLYDRDMSRRAKFRQLQHDKHAFYKSALRWWLATGSYFEFVAVPVLWEPDSHLVRVKETALIAQFRPMLNFPWINPLLRKARIQAPKYALPNTDQRGGVLGRRAHRQHGKFLQRVPCFQGGLANPELQNRVRLFGLVYKLGSTTVARLNASRILLCRETPISILYLLFRMTRHADEPVRTSARKQLVSLLRKRGGDAPPKVLPLKLMVLTARFHVHAQRWLAQFIRHHRSSFPPVHVPRAAFIEIRLRSLGKTLYNFRRFLTDWETSKSYVCVCV